MSTYELGFTYLEKHTDRDGFYQTDIIPGLRPMVPIAIVFSSLCRAIFESMSLYPR
jgi:hypothetical protein